MATASLAVPLPWCCAYTEQSRARVHEMYRM